MDALENRLRELEDEIRACCTCDPKRFRRLTEEITFARAAIDRWTDNITSIRKGLWHLPWTLLLHAIQAQGNLQGADWESQKNKLTDYLNCELRKLLRQQRAGRLDAVCNAGLMDGITLMLSSPSHEDERPACISQGALGQGDFARGPIIPLGTAPLIRKRVRTADI